MEPEIIELDHIEFIDVDHIEPEIIEVEHRT